MSNIISPYQHVRKPRYGTPIDWSNPLTDKLLGSWVLNEGGGPLCYSQGSIKLNPAYALSGLVRWNPYGIELDTTDCIETNLSLGSVGSPVTYTIVTQVIPIEITTLAGLVDCGRIEGGFYIHFYSGLYNPYGLGFDFYHGLTAQIGVPCTLGIVISGNNFAKLYVDGILRYSDSSITSTHLPRLRFGYASGGSAKIYICYSYIWNRELTSDEQSSIFTSPYQIYLSSLPYWFWSATLGGTAYSLDVDGGTYALTGSAASIFATRTLGMGPGSYSLTGSAASILATRKLEVGAGIYSLTGSNTSLLTTRTLEVEAGSYSLTGSDITTIFNRALLAGSGSYVLTGSAIAALRTTLIGAEAGSYTLTGTNASVIHGYVISAGSGTYLLTGSDLSFARGYSLTAASGTYVITGSAVTLTYSGISYRLYYIMKN